MGETGRPAASALGAALEEEARSLSFFNVVDLIEAQQPDCAPVGYRGPAAREALRFVGNYSLGFPSSDIDAIDCILDADGRIRYRMTVNFLGLYGQGSPIPIWYTEDIVHAELDEHAVKDFLDLFQHRLVSLFRRGWTKYRYYRDYKPDGSDPISQWLFALMGVLHPRLREGTSLNWQRLLAFAGLLAMRNRSAPMLRGLLSHYFPGTPIDITQFVRDLLPIAEDQRARLGEANCQLGVDLTIGVFVPDCASAIEVKIGPLGFERFQYFLPDGNGHAAVRELVQLVLIDQLQCGFDLTLRAAEIPALTLDEDSPCRLGWSTWLGHRAEDGQVLFAD